VHPTICTDFPQGVGRLARAIRDVVGGGPVQIWEDGYGGYRAEAPILVTETGYEALASGYSNAPSREGGITW
jgi:hypothetical protein